MFSWMFYEFVDDNIFCTKNKYILMKSQGFELESPASKPDDKPMCHLEFYLFLKWTLFPQ